jgi:hypothetical protein
VIIKLLREVSENQIGNEQCGFKNGRGCVDEVLHLGVWENYFEKQKNVFLPFIDIENVYDGVDRLAIWEALRICYILTIYHTGKRIYHMVYNLT